MVNRTFYFGEGLFETFKLYLYRGKLYFPGNINFHYFRLLRGLKFFKMPFISYDDFLKLIRDLFFKKIQILSPRGKIEKILEKKEPLTYRSKLIAISFGEKKYFGLSQKVKFFLEVEPLNLVSQEITLGISKYRKYSKNPLNFFKTTCYSFNILVKREAQREGFYDNIILNEKGELTETSSSNIYLKINNTIYTPPLASGILPGSIRDIFVKKGVVKVKVLYLEDLKKAEEVYISNAILGFKKAKVEI